MFKEFSPKSQNVISVDMISELPAAWVQVVDGEDGKKKSKQTFNYKIFATISRMRFCANQGMFLIGLTFRFVGKILIALLTLPYGRSFHIYTSSYHGRIFRSFSAQVGANSTRNTAPTTKIPPTTMFQPNRSMPTIMDAIAPMGVSQAKISEVCVGDT